MSQARCVGGTRPWQVAAVLLLAASSAFGDEFALPVDTARGIYPPFVAPVSEGENAQIAWVDRMHALGQARAGTDLGADLLLSAAHHTYRTMLDGERALPIYREALAAYTRGHPHQGVALLEIGSLFAAQGDWDGVGTTLRQFESWRMHEPTNADEATATRMAKARALFATREPELRIALHTGLGQFAEAAERVEARARTGGRLADWRQAAQLWALAKNKDAARRAGEDALGVATSPFDKAAIRMWMLYAEIDALDERGHLTMLQRWPGDDWHRKVSGFLDALGTDKLAVSYAVQLGFTYYRLGKFAEGIAMYERALRHPDVLRGAEGWNRAESFLGAVHAASDAGDFAGARRLLARLRLIFGHGKSIDTAEIAVRNAEEESLRPPRVPPKTTPKKTTAPATGEPRAGARTGTGRIVPGGTDGASAESAVAKGEADDDTSPTSTGLLALLVGGLLALGALIYVLGRR